MRTVSFETLGLEGVIPISEYLNMNMYKVSDKALSFVLYSDDNSVIGFVLLRANSIPSTYQIQDVIEINGCGVEILQIHCLIAEKEAVLLGRLTTRITIWCIDGQIAFDYMWSVSLFDATQFYSDCLDGECTQVLISQLERKKLIYVPVTRE